MRPPSISRYLQGDLKLDIKGLETERFLNLCAKEYISLKSIQPIASDEFHICITIKDFFRLKGYAAKTHTRIHILKKEGLTFHTQKLLTRFSYLIGIFICFLFLMIQTGFLMRIDIVGNYCITDEMILDYMKEQDVSIGKRTSFIVIEELEKSIRNHFPDFTWVSVKMQGNCLYVVVKENPVANIELVTDDTVCDLQATKSGRIASIVTRCGTPLCKKGDFVEEGSILVSGKVPIQDDGKNILYYNYVKADADILIDYIETFTTSVTFHYKTRIYTGNQVPGLGFRIMNRSFRFPLLPITYQKYSFLAKEEQLHIGRNLYFPIWMEQFYVKEYVLNQYQYSSSEAKAIVMNDLSSFFISLDKKGVQIIENNVKIEKDMLKMYLTCDMLLRGKCDQSSVIMKDENSSKPENL